MAISALLEAAGLFIDMFALQQVAKVLAGFWSARVAWTATNADMPGLWGG